MIKYLLALFLVCQTSLAQTKKHIAVPGTKCSIIPPEGFVAADNFSGFINTEIGISIIITEISAPYKTIIQGFTADALKAKGMILINKEIIDFNMSEATIIKVKQPSNGMMYLKQILIFGDSENTILVNGIYPEDFKSTEESLSASLLSAVYDPNQNYNFLDAVNFTLNTETTDFKVAKYMTGSLLYSTDGRIPTDKPTLIVGSSIAKISTNDEKQYAIERFKDFPDGELSIITSNIEVMIDNMKGYEIVGHGKNSDGKKELIYQVMLFNGLGDYYMLVGHASENLDKNLETYRAIAKTFRRK